MTVREGDAVKKGQRLATLDLDVLMASLDIARARAEATARLDSAEAELALRTTRLEKLKLLAASGNARPQEVERATADVEIAQAAVRLAQEDRLINGLECKRIQAQIDRRKIASPVDGVVTELFKHEAELVTAIDPRMLVVVQLDPLCVHFSVGTSQAASLAPGQRVKLSFADPPAKAEGIVEMISPVTDKASGTVKVKVTLANPKGALRSGVRCTLQLKGSGPKRGTGESGLGEPELGPLTYHRGN
jgi:RND family efflux transporter MFP subunit